MTKTRALPRLRVPLLGATLLLATAAARPAAAARLPLRLEPGFGVTPGGLVWTVEPVAHRLVLRDTTGSERAAFALGEEGHVLGVDDSGARVTSSTADGFRRRALGALTGREVEARYVFRFADGAVRTTVSTTALQGSDPAVLGDTVWLVRREKGRWNVVRVAPEGETSVATIAEEDVRRRAGRSRPPALFAGPSGVAVLFRGAWREAAVRLDRPGTFFVPDPLDACGEGRTRLVLPHGSGLLRVVARTAPATDGEGPGKPLAVAELLEDDGGLAGSTALGPFNSVLPLPDGGLLALDGTEAVRFDDSFREVSRAVLPLAEGSDPAAAVRIVEQLRRIEALGSRATGADWAELALVPGAPASSHLGLVRDDADGALARLVRVADGDPDMLEAAKAIALLAGTLRSERKATFLDRLREQAESGAPVWLRRAAAFALLSASPREAPAWALPAVADAIASGAAGEALELPDEAFTPELADLVTAVDRARIERVARERPEVAEALLAGSLETTLSGPVDELRYHAPARLFPRTLLACAAGPPSVAGLLALWHVVDAAGDDGPGPGDAAGRLVETRGPVAAALLDAQGSPDAGLRASGLAIGPLAGLPIDAGRFRADVLRRPDLASLAFLGLVADRGLTERTWLSLFQDLFFGARSASSDPSACAFAGVPTLDAVGEGTRDRYCNLFAVVRSMALNHDGDDGGAPFLSRARISLLTDFARSSAAPPELRLELEFRRAIRGVADEGELLELLGERSIPPMYRWVSLIRVEAGSPRLAAFLERELTSGRVASIERGRWLDALVRVDAPAADRVAADAWARGLGPLDADDERAGTFCSALDPERVRGSEALRAALRHAREAPATSLDAARALARAGDPDSAGPLARAVLETCPSCLAPSELSALFGPLGEEGVAALERLAREALPFAVPPLEALFEVDPGRAETLARSSLAASLARGCAPARLLPVLLAHGIDPFPDLLAALQERGCDRARMKPGEPVAAGIARPPATETGRAARRALASTTSATCRAALASLLGIPAEEPPSLSRDAGEVP